MKWMVWVSVYISSIGRFAEVDKEMCVEAQTSKDAVLKALTELALVDDEIVHTILVTPLRAA